LSKFVLDCSVVLAWIFPDEASVYADWVMEGTSTHQPVVPPVWALEFVNGLLNAERRGRIREADTDGYLADVAGVKAIIDTASLDSAERVLSLARNYNLSAYDASYLELAVRLGLPLATLDDRLRAAAAQVGIPIFQP
jgi:predicted nucleic acid-binding protein